MGRKPSRQKGFKLRHIWCSTQLMRCSPCSRIGGDITRMVILLSISGGNSVERECSACSRPNIMHTVMLTNDINHTENGRAHEAVSIEHVPQHRNPLHDASTCQVQSHNSKSRNHSRHSSLGNVLGCTARRYTKQTSDLHCWRSFGLPYLSA